MKKTAVYFILALLLAPMVHCFAQDSGTGLTGREVLERTIKHHDPIGLWASYKGKLFEVTVFPNNYVVKENIEIDNPNDFYLSTCFQEFGTLKRGIDKGKNIFTLDDKPEIPQDIKDNWGLSDEGIKMFSEIHHCHFGLPMVFKNSGMEIQDEVKTVDFDGHKCYAVTFTGKPGIATNPYYSGEQILYVDTDNYAMRGRKMKTSMFEGYTTFEGEININGIKVIHHQCSYDKEGNIQSSSTNLPVSE